MLLASIRVRSFRSTMVTSSPTVRFALGSQYQAGPGDDGSISMERLPPGGWSWAVAVYWSG